MDMDWTNLGFNYLPTKAFVQADYADGAWSAPTLNTEPYLSMHISANCFHYGQACFEGLKAFRTKEGKAVIFRPDMGAKRMILSGERICMQPPSEELFIEACKMAVKENIDYLPPYGTGASLYMRPFLIGTQPIIGVNPSDTYTFIVFVTPVGPYYKEGFSPVNALVVEGFDRAAAQGTGRTKVAGNYAASLKPGIQAKKKGFPIVLYTDPVEHKYIDEFGTSNFIGITDDEYQTPDSPSILQSITNNSLQTLSKEYGLTPVKMPIPLDEVDRFKEVGACGTAAVITPIYSITKGDKVWTFGDEHKAGKTLTKLYEHLQGIQYGERDDSYNWLIEV
ncbi:MAG: branched-chain amino acid aminotransferase [Fibrobacteria bacterium]|nr:branched-chain amino acid aminotransferase [Fibrobacteria bacterium]